MTTARPEPGSRQGNLTVGLVLEDHLGHRTFAENLVAEARRQDELDALWCPVKYEVRSSRLDRVPGMRDLRGTLAGRREVRSTLRRLDADVWVYNTQVPAALAGRARRSPYIVVTDVTPIQYDEMAVGYGHRSDRIRSIRRWKHHLNTKVFNEAEWCIPWSTWASTSIIDDYGVDPARVRTIPPGVDIEKWGTTADRGGSGRFRVLFVGGDFARKGGELLLQAFAGLSSKAELYLVTKTEIPNMDRVHVINDLEPNDPRLIKLFGQADVFVLPSRAETFGIAAVEASAAGLPVVASRVGGLTDIVIDGETGFLGPVDDVAELKRSLVRLEEDHDLRRRLGFEARAHAARSFNATTNANSLFDLVRACVTDPRA